MKNRTLATSWMNRRAFPLLMGLLLLPMGCGEDLTGLDCASLDVSPAMATLRVIGDTVRFTAVSRDSEGNATGLAIVLSSSNVQVATVEAVYTPVGSSVLATAVGNGTTIIRAVIPGGFGIGCGGVVEGSATLTVATP